MKPFSRLKTIHKGIEGALLSGGTVAAAIQVIEQSQDVDVSKVEEAATVLIAAVIGFTFKAIKNWLKNRGK